MRKKIIVLTLIGFAVMIGFVYFTMGLYIIHPGEFVPDGRTILYWRIGTNMPFIFSVKFTIYPTTRKAIAISALKEIHKERKIITLPYSKTLYLISTKVTVCY